MSSNGCGLIYANGIRSEIEKRKRAQAVVQHVAVGIVLELMT